MASASRRRRASPAPNWPAASPPRRIEVAGANPPPRTLEVAAATPPPPPAEHIAAAALPPPVAPPAAALPQEPVPPMEAAAAPRRHWPSLIAPAEAATLRPPLARRRPGSGTPGGSSCRPERLPCRRMHSACAPGSLVFGSAEIVPATKDGAALYRVRVGPVTSGAEAQLLLSKVVDRGYPGARLVQQ